MTFEWDFSQFVVGVAWKRRLWYRREFIDCLVCLGFFTLEFTWSTGRKHT